MEWSKGQIHSKIIIHIDIDCFYVQVELLRKPHLHNEPVGVTQKNVVLTCNYKARKFGVKKGMLISEALQLCPQLLLFNSGDFHKYHHASHQIHLFLLSYTSKVQKTGLDESCIDVTDLVKAREQESKQVCFKEIIGHCVGNLRLECGCGCHRRLIIGSQIADEIRFKLKTELGFTSCCGISYNRMLAKMSSSTYRPNQQTTLLPNGALQFLQNLKEVDKIPGMGEKLKQVLQSVNIRAIKDFHDFDLKHLKNIFKNKEYEVSVKDLSIGVCDSLVKQSEKFNTVVVENGFRKLSVISDVKEKFQKLLERLLVMVEEDGRKPMTVSVTIRIHNSERKFGYKESKQSSVPSSLFSHPFGKLTEDSTNKLLNIIMGLFLKMITRSKPFHITLLGLAFSKFHEKVNSNSVASFLLRERNLSVQSLTSFVSDEVLPDVTNVITSACNNFDSDSDAEPSPKKTKLDAVVKKKDLAKKKIESYSPSKLNVQNLNINENYSFSKKCLIT